MDANVCVATFGDDSHGKYGGWISIAGEWVRLDSAEIGRLMKKRRQAVQIRKQWEKETGLKAR